MCDRDELVFGKRYDVFDELDRLEYSVAVRRGYAFTGLPQPPRGKTEGIVEEAGFQRGLAYGTLLPAARFNRPADIATIPGSLLGKRKRREIVATDPGVYHHAVAGRRGVFTGTLQLPMKKLKKFQKKRKHIFLTISDFGFVFSMDQDV